MGYDFQVAIRAVLLQLHAAISTAWDETREQVTGFDPLIRQSCFGQILLANVMRRVHELDTSSEYARVHLKPNKRKTAHHIEVEMPGFLCTISAVRHDKDIPRYAYFRYAIAKSHQSYFTYSAKDGACKFCPPDPIPDSLKSYVQILHGPSHYRNNREEMGFIRVAFLDRSHGEQWRVTTVAKFLETLATGEDDLLDAFAPKPAAIEEIDDLLSGQFELLEPDLHNLNEDRDEGTLWQ